MRKLFWVCLAGGVLLVAGVFTTAHVALRHPRSFCGQVLFGASHAVATLNPLHGLSPLAGRVEQFHKAQARCEVAGAAEEQQAAADEEKPAEDAPIVIVEDDNLLRTSPAPEEPRQYGQGYVSEGPSAAELAAGAGAQASPAVMPYASEESCPGACRHTGCPRMPCQPYPGTSDVEACEQLHMPTVEECEALPMPSAEEEQEDEEVSSGCPTGGAVKLLRLFGQMIKQAPHDDPCPESQGEPSPTPDCREDYHYHHHYPACPYTGRSYCPCPQSGHHGPTPAAEPEKPAVPGGEEASEEGGKSALKKIRSYKAREADDRCPVCPGVDTMEMRPEDRQLYEYGPGVL